MLERDGGRLGVTFAPGKKARSAYGSPWSRDLDLDLGRMRQALGVEVLVPLVEDDELLHLAIPDLVPKAEALGMTVHRLPIPDGEVPEPAAALLLVDRIVAALAAKQTVVVHCRGGLGRAGTIAACTLVRLGETPKDAMATVRRVRPGAIENRRQERFVEQFRG